MQIRFKNTTHIITTMEQVHILAWNTIDSYQDNRGFVMQGFGRSMNNLGDAVRVEIEGFRPFFRLRISKTTTREETDAFFRKFQSLVRGLEPKYIFESKMPLYPYHKYYERFVKLYFNGEYSRKKAAERIRSWIQERDYSVIYPYMQLYDDVLPSLLCFQHEANILPTGHIGFHMETVYIDNNGVWHVPYMSVFPIEDDRIASFRMASFDIECLSYDSYVKKSCIFPDFKKEKDVVAQIGTCIMTLNSGIVERHIFVLDCETSFFCNRETINDTESGCSFFLYAFAAERDLLLEWSRFIGVKDPDVFIGYNIFGFDWNYIHERCLFHRIEEEFCRNLSRTSRFDRMFQKRQLCSVAYGDNEMTFYDPVGRLNIDLYVHIKKEFKLDSYKLDNVAQHFLKDKKNPMPPIRLFQALKESRDSCIEVAKYCIQDCILVIDLLVYLKVFPSIMEMSNISRIPFDYVLMRGQQIRCFSLICYHAARNNYAVPEKIKIDDKATAFQGGFVMEPKSAVFMDDPVSVLDVMSLYPSLIIAYNLCYSTVVTAANDDSSPVETVEISEERKHRFVKKEVRVGLLSIILEGLWESRQSIKKIMKTCNKQQYLVLDARQLAIKLCMNSLYGLTGVTSDYAMLSCTYIAESITALGRSTILFAKGKIEEWYGANTVLYIDSDSLFVCFRGDTKNNLQRAFQLGFEAEAKLNEILPYPIKMEMEKIIFPFIILTKKRYCGLVYEDPEDLSKSKILYKGLSVVRRDFCSFTKTTIEDAMIFVFMERNIQKAYEHVQSCVKDLLEGRVSSASLVMSKTLSSKHAEMKDAATSTLPHVALYAKMKSRDPNNCPRSGERVEFLYTVTGDKLLRDKVESPDYVRENVLPLDYLYYYENQLNKPLEELFGLLLAPEPFEPVGKSKDAAALLRSFMKKEKYKSSTRINKRNGQTEIDFFFTKKIRQNMLEEQKELKQNILDGKETIAVMSSVFDNMPSVKMSKNA